MKNNMNVIRSNRKSISIEIRQDATILVRAPYQMQNAEINRFIKEKENWITKHLKKAEDRQREMRDIQKFSVQEIQKLTDLALKIIPVKVKYFAGVMNVNYGRITIRNQKTRWGSCSAKRNLNFNCLLMLAPDEVVDYVVVHELCHLIEMNHSKKFWAQVEQVMPDYKKHKQWLKDYGNEIIGRIY